MRTLSLIRTVSNVHVVAFILWTQTNVLLLCVVYILFFLSLGEVLWFATKSAEVKCL
jgi:hypothetical protein